MCQNALLEFKTTPSVAVDGTFHTPDLVVTEVTSISVPMSDHTNPNPRNAGYSHTNAGWVRFVTFQ